MLAYNKYNILVRFYKLSNYPSSFLPMKTFMHFAQLLVGNMGIYLGCRDRGVAQHSLNRTDIRAGNQQVSRKGMP